MKKFARAAVLVLIVLGAAAFYWGNRRNADSGVKIGGDAPDFTVPGMGRSAYTLSGFKGQVVVLNFWATWCPPCVAETPSLEKFSVDNASKGVVVFGVSVDEDPAALEKFIADYHLTFPIGRDPSRAIATRYGTLKFPETYIIDRNGRVAEKVISNVNWQDPRIKEFIGYLASDSAGTAK